MIRCLDCIRRGPRCPRCRTRYRGAGHQSTRLRLRIFERDGYRWRDELLHHCGGKLDVDVDHVILHVGADETNDDW